MSILELDHNKKGRVKAVKAGEGRFEPGLHQLIRMNRRMRIQEKVKVVKGRIYTSLMDETENEPL